MEQTGNSTTVVLVDQSGQLESRCRDELTASGFEVTVVASARECLRLVEMGGVGAVLSEQFLPDVTGLRLLRSIRISHPVLPFLLVPSAGSEDLAGEAFEVGASGYVPGDADAATIVSRISKRIRRDESDETEEYRNLYRHLIEVSPAPINLFDETGDTIWGNNAVLDLLGLEGRHELIGTSIFEYIHPDDRTVAHEEVETVIEQKESVGPTRMKLQRPDGGVRHILVSTAVGEFLGTSIGQAVILDITDRYERDRQLETLDHWLRHNIRTKINIISGLASQIDKDERDIQTSAHHKLQSHCDHLLQQANAERKIIQLLTEPPIPKRENLTQIVEEEVRRCREQYPGATIELDRRDDLEAWTIPEFCEAVRELIVNAIQHNDSETPLVRVSVISEETPGGHVRVTDNGPGIPVQEQEAVRLDGDIDHLTHSSGLGLVFVTWVLRLSRGTLTFEDNDPEGSIITLELSND